MTDLHGFASPRGEIPRSVLLSGLWLRGGFAGASAAAIGALGLLNGGMQAPTALALLIVGVAAGGWSLRRAWQVLGPESAVTELSAPAASAIPTLAARG